MATATSTKELSGSTWQQIGGGPTRSCFLFRFRRRPLGLKMHNLRYTLPRLRVSHQKLMVVHSSRSLA